MSKTRTAKRRPIDRAARRDLIRRRHRVRQADVEKISAAEANQIDALALDLEDVAA